MSSGFSVELAQHSTHVSSPSSSPSPRVLYPSHDGSFEWSCCSDENIKDAFVSGLSDLPLHSSSSGIQAAEDITMLP